MSVLAGWLGLGGDGHDAWIRMVATLDAATPRAEARELVLPGTAIALRDPAGRPGGRRIHRDGDDHYLVLLGDLYDADAVLGPGSGPIDLARRVFEAWHVRGPALWADLEGDFAVIVASPRARTLVLVTDDQETFSLYHRRVDGACLFSTELPVMAASAATPLPMDPAYFIDNLIHTMAPAERSPLLGVSRVPPGHQAIITPDGVHLSRTWRPEDVPDVRLPRDADYVEAVRDLVAAAVRRRLPATGRVGAHLSAGLDSTLVASVAAPILHADGRGLDTYTLATDPAVVGDGWQGTYWDEAGTATAYGRSLPGARAHAVSLDPQDPWRALDAMQHAAGGPMWTVHGVTGVSDLHRLAAGHGVRVMLDGIGGNITTSSPGLRALPGFVLGGRWLRLLKEWRALADIGIPLPSALAHSFGPLLPANVERLARRLTGKPEPYALAALPLRPDLLARGDTTEGAPRAGNARRARAAMLAAGPARRTTQAVRRLHGISLRHPLMDKALVRFCLGIPDEQYLRHGETRHLARRVLRGLGAPPAITDERRMAVRYAGWHATLTHARSEIERDLAAMAQSPGCGAVLDVERVRRLVAAMPNDGLDRRQVYLPYLQTVCTALSVGRYICRLEGRNG